MEITAADLSFEEIMNSDGSVSTGVYYLPSEAEDPIPILLAVLEGYTPEELEDIEIVFPDAPEEGETITGTDGRDALYGTSGDDTLVGKEGADYLDGGDGDDILQGGEGRDTLIGGGGNNQLFGGAGNDYLEGSDGDDQLYGGDGDDGLAGARGNNELRGQNGNDHIIGGYGDDQIFGGAGNDLIHTLAGDGIVDGGDGDDTIVAYDGNVVMTGGSGADVFVLFEAPNTSPYVVTDFDIEEDSLIIDLLDIEGYTISDLSFREIVNADGSVSTGVYLSLPQPIGPVFVAILEGHTPESLADMNVILGPYPVSA